MQKTAISLTRRSAVLSRLSSARQPDFRILWNVSIFQRKAYQRSFSTAAPCDRTGKSVISFQSIAGRSAGGARPPARVTPGPSAGERFFLPAGGGKRKRRGLVFSHPDSAPPPPFVAPTPRPPLC